jgi:leader peptidase (prepilin peptidase)/N-methyltransferase
MTPLILGDFPVEMLVAFALAFGLAWGSFLNVVIYRVPREMSVVRPPSHCPACKKPIKPWDNIPLFGWILLRGKARCCGVRVPFRYPMVEGIGGLVAVAIAYVLFRTMPADTPFWRYGATFVVDLAMGLALVAAAFIDLEHMFIPDSITIGSAVVGVLSAGLRGAPAGETFTGLLGPSFEAWAPYLDALLGAGIGFLAIWAPFVAGYRRLTGHAGMGTGDAKLLAGAGAWFGWPGALFVLGAGAIQGTLGTLVLLGVKGKIEEPEAVRRERAELQAELAAMTPEERAVAEKELADDPLMAEPGKGMGQARIPFGPFLILAELECLLFGHERILDAIAGVAGWITGD